jgi:hypothetical protein
MLDWTPAGYWPIHRPTKFMYRVHTCICGGAFNLAIPVFWQRTYTSYTEWPPELLSACLNKKTRRPKLVSKRGKQEINSACRLKTLKGRDFLSTGIHTRREASIKIDTGEISLEDVHWIRLAQNGAQYGNQIFSFCKIKNSCQEFIAY